MPGTPPQGWQTPKTSYTSEDVTSPDQFERIEGNIYAIEQGARTIDPGQAPTGNVGTLRQFLDWFANRIKAILGTTNWYDAPPTTLKAAKSHIDAAAPHSGHETPTGAQAKVDAHAAGTSVHGATSSATANRIVMRDANGRAKVAAPSASDDIARKDTVDAKFDVVTGHKHTGAPGDGPKLSAESIVGGIVQPSTMLGRQWRYPRGIVPIDTTYNRGNVCYAADLGGLLIAAGDRLFRSMDGGESWSLIDPTPFSTHIRMIVRAQGLFVGVGGRGSSSTYPEIWTSPDGLTWTRRLQVANQQYRYFTDIVWWPEKNLFIAVGADDGAALIYTSPDGITWTQRTAGSHTDRAITGIAVNAAKAIAVGGNGEVWQSTNGTTWTSSIPLDTTSIGGFIIWFPKLNRWVTRGAISDDNGQTWQQVPGLRSSITSPRKPATDGNIIVIASGKVIFRSETGIAWEPVLDVTNAVQSGGFLHASWTGQKFFVSGVGTTSLMISPVD